MRNYWGMLNKPPMGPCQLSEHWRAQTLTPPPSPALAAMTGCRKDPARSRALTQHDVLRCQPCPTLTLLLGRNCGKEPIRSQQVGSGCALLMVECSSTSPHPNKHNMWIHASEYESFLSSYLCWDLYGMEYTLFGRTEYVLSSLKNKIYMVHMSYFTFRKLQFLNTTLILHSAVSF